MIVIQLLFARRDGADIVLDGVLVRDPRSPGTPANTPMTFRLRLPEDVEWRARLTEILERWARTSRIVRVAFDPTATRTVVEVACARSKIRLDLVEAPSFP